MLVVEIDEQDHAAHMDCIHFDPVKYGLVEQASDWPFSSFANCVRLGMYASDWTLRGDALGETGERV